MSPALLLIIVAGSVSLGAIAVLGWLFIRARADERKSREDHAALCTTLERINNPTVH